MTTTAVPKSVSGGSSGTALALVTLTAGGIMVYSALKGISIVDVLAGKAGATLNPGGKSYEKVTQVSKGVDAGVSVGSVGETPSVGSGSPDNSKFKFKGPNATDLAIWANVAEKQFKLKAGETPGTGVCKGCHVPGSDHYSGRATDISGSAEDMKAFSTWVHKNHKSKIKQLIHNAPGKAFAVNNGKDVGAGFFSGVWAGHRNHVHISA